MYTMSYFHNNNNCNPCVILFSNIVIIICHIQIINIEYLAFYAHVDMFSRQALQNYR